MEFESTDEYNNIQETAFKLYYRSSSAFGPTKSVSIVTTEVILPILSTSIIDTSIFSRRNVDCNVQ